MGDFSFLDNDPPPRARTNRQQGVAAAAAAPSAGTQANAGQPQQQPQQRVRIQLPSFKQVQAAEAPARPINTFQPGTLQGSSNQQQQQQPQSQSQLQPQQSYAWPPPPPQQQGAAGASAQQQQPQQQQPAWAASLPPMSLNAQLPRFSQAAAGGGGASTGTAVGISRPTVPLPPAAAATASGAGGGASQPGGGAGGGGGVGTSHQQPQPQQQQQQQVPLNAVLVSRRQQGNPVLKHIRSVRWVFADIVPDYLCGQNTALLFLSLRYHLLQPEYVLSRLQALQRVYRLSVLLLLVDAEEVVKPLLELHKAALGAQAVLVCAWSNEECARYIETFKAYENRPASSIMEHTDTDYMGRLSSVLTSIRGVNRSDAYSLARHFGSLADVFTCEEPEGFASIPGLGPVKAKRLFDTFNQPFRRTLTAAAAAAGAGGGGSGSSQQQQQQGVGAAPPSSQQQAQAANTGSAEQQQQREQQEEVEGEGEEQQESEDMEGLAALAELEAQLHSTQQQQQQGAVDAAAEGGDPDGGGAGEEQEGAGEYDAAAEGDVDLVEGGSYVEEDYLASFGGDGGYDDDGLVDEEL